MKNGMPEHYWRIHKRVALRVWGDTPPSVRQTIALDESHETLPSQWFGNKVNEDASRLFEDPEYYDNASYTFRIPRK